MRQTHTRRGSEGQGGKWRQGGRARGTGRDRVSAHIRGPVHTEMHPPGCLEEVVNPRAHSPEAWGGMRTKRPGQDVEVSRGWGVSETIKEKTK